MTLRKISKKRAERGEKYTLKRSPVKRVNPKRKKAEFARCYHSKQRVEFVKSLPCAACGVVGYSENAHVLGNGGLSRKGDYAGIAPLCGPHPSTKTVNLLLGCHRLFHKYGQRAWIAFDPEIAAQQTEQKWQEHLKETA